MAAILGLHGSARRMSRLRQLRIGTQSDGLILRAKQRWLSPRDPAGCRMSLIALLVIGHGPKLLCG
jgi:hypothetical protein